MEEKTIAPIQTYYNGYHFRSRLEARWAVFFDEIGVEYEYEPEGFKLPGGEYYLPDFKLHNVGGRNSYSDILWVEVKGDLTERDLNKIKKFRGDPIENPIFIVGEIPYSPYGYEDAFCNYRHHNWSNGLNCYFYNLEFVDYDYFGGFFVRLKDGRVFLEDENNNGYDAGWEIDEYTTNLAYLKARQARFEHGETPWGLRKH